MTEFILNSNEHKINNNTLRYQYVLIIQILV